MFTERRKSSRLLYLYKGMHRCITEIPMLFVVFCMCNLLELYMIVDTEFVQYLCIVMVYVFVCSGGSTCVKAVSDNANNASFCFNILL